MKSLRTPRLVLLVGLMSYFSGSGADDPLDHWRKAEMTGQIPTHAIRYGQGRWLGLDRASLLASSNGRHWEVSRTFAQEDNPTDLHFADGLWMLVGTRQSTNVVVLTSTNAADWSAISLPHGQVDRWRIRHSPQEWILVGSAMTTFFRSTDGRNWTASPLGDPPIITQLSNPPNGGRWVYGIADITQGDGYWVAAVNEEIGGNGGGSLAISTNLKDWQWWRRPALAQGRVFESLHCAHGLWFGVSRNYWVQCSAEMAVISSTDGTNWAPRFSISYPGPEVGEVTIANNRILAVASTPWGCLAITTNSSPASAFPISESAPLISLQPNRPGELVVQRASGIPVVVEASDDLQQWHTLTNLAQGAAVQPFRDSAAATIPRRFYRSRSPW